VNITGRGLFGKLCVCEHLRQTYATVLPTSRVIFPAKSAKLWVFRRSFASQNGEALCPVTLTIAILPCSPQFARVTSILRVINPVILLMPGHGRASLAEVLVNQSYWRSV